MVNMPFLFLLFVIQSAIQEAESHNDRARVEFKEGRFENASQQYTRALDCLPKDQAKEERAKYFTNRAACYVKMVCNLI